MEKIKNTLITETEFTYYPDNPPGEERYEQSILLNRELNIINPS